MKDLVKKFVDGTDVDIKSMLNLGLIKKVRDGFVLSNLGIKQLNS